MESQQSRFGPAPVTVLNLSLRRRGRRWSVVTGTYDEAGESRRGFCADDLDLADALEALITELYRIR